MSKRKCKYGKLKSPSGRRVCKKAGHKSKARCRWGKLAHPIGRRICKKPTGKAGVTASMRKFRASMRAIARTQ